MEQIVQFHNATLHDLIQGGSERYPDVPAVVQGDQTLTYQDLAEAVTLLARQFTALGFGRGDRVALWVTTRIEWVLADLALARIGAIMVAINTRLTAHEVAHMLTQSRSKGLIMMPRFRRHDYAGMLLKIAPDLKVRAGSAQSSALPELRTVVFTEPDSRVDSVLFSSLLQLGGSAKLPPPPSPDDPVNILYTSGTTSFPKGVVLSHRSLVAPNVYSGLSLGLKPGERIYVGIPAYFGFFCLNLMVAALSAGATMVLHETFDASEAVALIQRHGCSVIYGNWAMYSDLIEHCRMASTSLPTLRTGFIFPTRREYVRAVVEDLGICGIGTVYGLTESGATTILTDNRLPIAERMGWDQPGLPIGRPNPIVDAIIADPETHTPAVDGVMGEIWLRGPQIMKGYFELPEQTEAAVDEEGWLHTGDLGIRDVNGDFYFVGRIKEVLKIGGITVAASEIEEVLERHPGVRQVSVIGIPDQRLDQIPVAFVVLSDGGAADPKSLHSHCAQFLATYKIPRHFRLVSELPLTGSGKIQRHTLEEMARAEFGQTGT